MSKTPSFVLTLKLNTSDKIDRQIAHRFYCGVKMYNVLVKYCNKQIRKLWKDKNYQVLLTERKMFKPDDTNKKQLNELNQKLADIRMFYGLSEYQLHDYVKIQQFKYRKQINSHVAQKIASEVWKGCEKVLFGNGKKLHYKRYDNFSSLEGKNNQTGIVYRNGRIIWGKTVIGVQHHPDNLYEAQVLKNRVKYCRIVKRPMGTKYHYYVQLVLEGVPPMKHVCGTGRVGIDIGASTVAVVSDNFIDLDVLGLEVENVDKTIRCIQRAMERSKRATNPDNFNQDGTVKKGRKKWNFSHNYKQLRMKKHSLESKRAAALKQSHECRVNEIIFHGDEIYVETMCFKGLQRRSKETTKNSKGKFNNKSRFGKSLENHAPSMFLDIIDRKLKYFDAELHRINTKTFRASQYNHIKDDYVKKRLSNRWQYFENFRIQRDLYSAFLLMNSNTEMTNTDRNLCLETFEYFKDQHDILINTLAHRNDKLPSSFGIKKTA